MERQIEIKHVFGKLLTALQRVRVINGTKKETNEKQPQGETFGQQSSSFDDCGDESGYWC